MIPRLFQAQLLSPHTIIHLDEKASHHVASVLRAKSGDPLILFNGKGGEYEAIIRHSHKKIVEVEIISFKSIYTESPMDIYLAQGLARGEKMDFIIQKTVELGVRKIIPIITEYSNVKLNAVREEKRLAHWQAIMMSACEQCGRDEIPDILRPVPFKQWITQAKADVCYVLSPHEVNTLPIKKLSPGNKMILLIGPEGGLSPHENELAKQHGFLPLHLGPRILRTETAAISAMTIAQFICGD